MLRLNRTVGASSRVTATWGFNRVRGELAERDGTVA